MRRRLTLVAGDGDLVPHLAAAMLRKGEPLQILDLLDERSIAGIKASAAPLSDPRGLISKIRDFGTTHLVLAGGVHISDAERRGLADALGLAGRLAGSLGDIGLAGMILLQGRLSGIRLVGAHEVAPELLATAGHIAGPPVPPGIDLRNAVRAARLIGTLDLGQSIVLSGKRPVAAEDAGGTDDLLDRVAVLRAAGLVGNGGRPLVLAKARKPKQPRFVDLPAIGPRTIDGGAKAGISVIVVEAGASLVLERQEVSARAKALGVTVVGHHG